MPAHLKSDAEILPGLTSTGSLAEITLSPAAQTQRNVPKKQSVLEKQELSGAERMARAQTPWWKGRRQVCSRGERCSGPCITMQIDRKQLPNLGAGRNKPELIKAGRTSERNTAVTVNKYLLQSHTQKSCLLFCESAC